MRGPWRRRLLATTSIVSFAAGALVGIAPPRALAACSTAITGNVTGCTNATTITGINVHSANVSSSINNTGTISPNGITVQTNSTITGGIIDTGTIAGGISVDNTSTIAGGANAAISIGATFDGGVTNAGILTSTGNSAALYIANSYFKFSGGVTNTGTISGAASGVAIANLASFSGGITNSGTVSSPGEFGLIVTSVITNFTGGITNSGVIDGGAIALFVDQMSTFTGGITNTGTISSSSAPLPNASVAAIEVGQIGTFQGDIVNGGGTGKLTSAEYGIAIFDITTLNGSVINDSSITAQSGIYVNDVATFSGNISNGGQITATHTGIAIVGSTIDGSIVNSGNMLATNVGISIDNLSVVNSTKTAVLVQGSGLTFTGGISNAGVIQATDRGILVDGLSTFFGGITNSGTISAGAGIGVGNLTTFTGGISNAGTITVAGSGIALNAISTFASGIVNTGTLMAGGQGIVVGSVSAFSGGISNVGRISAADSGIQLSGISTFGGNVSNSGTINAAIGIEVGAGVTFAAGSAIVNSGNITGTTAAIDASAATSPVTIDQTGGTITGAIKLSTNADILNITGGTISGNIVGLGANDTINFAPLSGTFTYGASFGFTGINQVNINSGTVILNGTNNATNIDVNNTGTLAGTGTLDPLTTTIHSGGTLEPGTPGTPGTLTITGNLLFQSGATYLVQIGSGGAGRTNVTGTATLDGTISADFLPGAAIAHQYTLLHSAGLGGSTFASFNTINLPAGLTATLTYVPAPTTTDVDLNLTGNLSFAAPPGGFNINQQNVATALNNYFNSGGTLPPGFSNVFGLSGTALANALTQISGEAATGDQQAATQMMTEFLDMMLDPFVAGRDTGGGSGAGASNGFAPEQQASLPPKIALAYDSVMPAPRPADFDRRWSVWGSGFGGSSSTNGNAVVGSHDVTANTYGAAAGMDYHFTPDAVLGFALAGAGSNWSLTQNIGGGRSTAFQAGVYSKANFGPAYLAAAFAFANNWFTTSRTAVAADQLSASFQGQSYGGRFEAGYRIAVASASGVTPYAAVQAQAFRTPGYSETDASGGGFGLSYGAMNATDTRSELGARFDSLQIVDAMPLVWHGLGA